MCVCVRAGRAVCADGGGHRRGSVSAQGSSGLSGGGSVYECPPRALPGAGDVCGSFLRDARDSDRRGSPVFLTLCRRRFRIRSGSW